MGSKLRVLGAMALTSLAGFVTGCGVNEDPPDGTGGSGTGLCAEVVCAEGFSCIPDSGRCIADDLCAGMVCDAGETCVDGQCIVEPAAVDPCADVVCGAGQTCVDGLCTDASAEVDPCLGVVCDAGQTCVDGQCVAEPAAVDPCADVACGAGETCVDGQCVPTPPETDPCAGVVCDAGQICVDGQCVVEPAAVDPCEGVVCDDGVACTDDVCVDGNCVSTPDDAACPDDGVFCNGIEICDAVQGCVSSGDPCTPQETCDEAAGMCVQAPASESFVLSKNADFSTDDLTYSATDTIHIMILTDKVDYNDIKKADWELRSGTDKVKKPLANNMDDSYTASFNLSDLPSNATDWTFKANVEDNAGKRYQPTTQITVALGPPPACTTDADCDDGIFCNGAEACDAVQGCISGNNPCQASETCDETTDTCVPGDPCAGVTCNANETCVNGTCVPNDPCAGVTCNANETCVNGTCVPNDPCAGVTCNPGESCVNGTCVVDDPVAAGQALYIDWNCGACHGADGRGGSAPDLQGVGATKVFKKITGQGHPVTVPGATQQDADYLAAWFATL